MSQRVPRPILRITSNNTNYEEFCALKNDIEFMTKFIKICDTCFQSIRSLMLMMNSPLSEDDNYENGDLKTFVENSVKQDQEHQDEQEHQEEDQAGDMTETFNEDDYSGSDDEGGVVIKSDNEPSEDEDKK